MPLVLSETAVIYQIPSENLSALNAAIERLNRRASRLGCTPIEISVCGMVEEEDFKGSLVNGEPVTGPLRLNVQINGSAPVLNGWQFVATQRRDTDTGSVILARVPTVVTAIPEAYRATTPYCDHCQTNRQRNDTYLVRNLVSGDFKQVGRNCLCDFLGGHNPHQIARMAEYLIEAGTICEAAGENGFGGGRGVALWSLDVIMSFTVACVTAYGWVSGKTARERGGDSTATEVMLNLTRSNLRGTALQPRLVTPTPDDYRTGQRILDWVRAQEGQENGNDYLLNLVAACRGEYVSVRNLGIAVSALAAYERAMNRAQETADRPVSQFVGEPRQRLTFMLKCDKVIRYVSDWGSGTIFLFSDAAGNVLKWSTNSAVFTEGKWYTGKATVKKHSTYRNVNQTEISRASFVEAAPTAG